MQFCSEWIHLADSTGQTHKFEKETEIKQGADGKFYLDYGPFVDYRFFAVVAFVIAILVCGIRAHTTRGQPLSHAIGNRRPAFGRRFIDLIAEGERSVGKKYVYYFGDGKAEGTGTMKELLGGKGAGLAEMTNLEISVPPGFTISTEACVEYYKRGKAYPPGMMEEAACMRSNESSGRWAGLRRS